jgi:hypothetical protein
MVLSSIVNEATIPQHEPLYEALDWDRLLTSRRRSLISET